MSGFWIELVRTIFFVFLQEHEAAEGEARQADARGRGECSDLETKERTRGYQAETDRKKTTIPGTNKTSFKRGSRLWDWPCPIVNYSWGPKPNSQN